VIINIFQSIHALFQTPFCSPKVYKEDVFFLAFLVQNRMILIIHTTAI